MEFLSRVGLAFAIELHESGSEVLVMGAARKLAMSSHGVSKKEPREEEMPWQDIH